MDGAMTRPHHEIDVPVSGGSLRVGVWDSADPAATTVVLIHGVTASHLAWQWVADALPGVRLIAPDLRGRGRSADLPVGAGMADHADDLAAVFRHLAVPPSLVVGHSMGGFVAVVFAHRHPQLVTRLLLVDGGLPLAAPDGLSPDDLVHAVLGPTAERLGMRFADVDEYFAFWREHPAFAADWSAAFERYLRYDLVPSTGGYRPATSFETTRADTVDLHTGTTLPDALAAVRHPLALITVSRGLRDEAPGLYPPAHLAELLTRSPRIGHERWDDVNHYTVVMSPLGAERIAERISRLLG